MERGETQREIAEMKRNLKIAGAKSEDAMAAAASQRAELEAANAALLSARHRESSLQQQTEMRALELAQEREMASAAAATGELRTSQLIQELDNLKRTKASNSEDADAAHNTIKELRMRLVSREEECGKSNTHLRFRLGMDLQSCSATTGRTMMLRLCACTCVQVSYNARLTNLPRAIPLAT